MIYYVTSVVIKRPVVLFISYIKLNDIHIAFYLFNMRFSIFLLPRYLKEKIVARNQMKRYFEFVFSTKLNNLFLQKEVILLQ